MKNQNNQNLILAIALSILVLVGWNYFYGVPKMQKAREAAVERAKPPTAPGAPQTQMPAGAGSPGAAIEPPKSRRDALAASPRVAIDTPKLKGSINLKGGRIDDIELKAYRETTEPTSPNIVLFSPAGGPDPSYADFGFSDAAAPSSAIPPGDALWNANGATLTPAKPLVLTYDNGKGLLFTRTISVDDAYLFTVADTIENKGTAAVALTPFASVSRHYEPVTSGYSVLYEGMIGVIGDSRLQEETYSAAAKEPDGTKSLSGTGGFIGFTDKYWATALVPDQKTAFRASFRAFASPIQYQTDVVPDAPVTVAPGASTTQTVRVFVGAKVNSTIENYENAFGIKSFDLLIDWGWFYFITKPLFRLIDWLYGLVGNFGIAILITTVILKTIFYPIANKNFQSMAKMKALQPQMAAIRERFPDDKVKQQQATMELYKKEKVNPVAGCLPMLIQIPVFFALYKVIFVTIEMRQAPFFGWIRDLSAPDPTSVFNLFGLVPYTPPHFLQIGIWPLIMGFTMFLQMKMNPAPADPVQKSMFNWMPVIFTFMLGTFPAGLVIYYSWSNLLTLAQQYIIMRKAGMKVELWNNLSDLVRRKPASP